MDLDRKLGIAILLFFVLWNPFSPPQSLSRSNLRYYGHYFVEDPGKNQTYIYEVRDFTNLVNMRYDNGPNNSWDRTAASRVKDSGVKVMLQVPFGTDSDQTLFVDRGARINYLNKIRQDMLETDFMPSLAYFAVYEEWYVLINQGFYDKWPIFQGKTKEEKFAIAKSYLEQIIDDVHNIFPGIPTVIVENILPYPAPPSNVDILGIDAYYIPENSSCDSVQRAKFEREVLPYFDAAKPYNKPMMMVAPSFIGGPWKMLSECQMQWYADLAVGGQYDIESFLWFFYADTSGFTGVRNFSDLVNRQKGIGCQILGNPYCAVPAPTPVTSPTPAGPAAYTVNLQASNGQYVAAEGNGGGIINANRDVASLWETFELKDLNGGQLVSGDNVGIKTGDGYYFRAEGGGGSEMNAAPRSLGDRETFTIEKAGGGIISNNDGVYFRASDKTHFVVAEGGGGEIVRANRTAAYAWETFTLKIVGQTATPTPIPTPAPPSSTDYSINLQASNGQFVAAEGNGGGSVNANRDNAYAWETFNLIDINGGQLQSGDKVGIRTSDNYYFRAENGGGSELDARSQGLGTWETFLIERSGGETISNDNQVFLRTWDGTHFVVAEGGGGEIVKANRTWTQAWETFTLRIR